MDSSALNVVSGCRVLEEHADLVERVGAEDQHRPGAIAVCLVVVAKAGLSAGRAGASLVVELGVDHPVATALAGVERGPDADVVEQTGVVRQPERCSR